MLLALRKYLQSHPNCTLGELGLHFSTPVEVLSAMLDLLRYKGLVAEMPLSQSCRGCQSSCSACPLTSES